MNPISRRALLAALPAAAAITGGSDDTTADCRIVVFTRHAEKGDDDPTDPDLSEAGIARAKRLADVLANSGATRLLASEMKRARQTLVPLAERLQLDVLTYSASATNDKLWIDALSSAGHRVTIVASHSNSIPRLVHQFGGTLEHLDEHGNLPENEYGRLIVMTLRGQDAAATAVATLELMLP